MKSFQSLSPQLMEKIFKRDDIRGLCPEDLNEDVAYAVGHAFARMAACRLGRPARLVAGGDMREHSLVLEEAFAQGAVDAGATVTVVGRCMTEQIYFYCGSPDYDFDAGCMVTASHNPKQYNGMKFVWKKAIPCTGPDLQALRELLCQDCQDSLTAGKLLTELSGPSFYEHILNLAGVPAWPAYPEKLRVVIEAGNGAGGQGFAPFVETLSHLNCQVIICHGELAPSFPLGVPNPLLAECQQRLCQEVLEHKADLGIIFDGDADRAGFATDGGKMLSGSEVLALISLAKLEQRKLAAEPESAIIMKNLSCSLLLDEIVAQQKNCRLVQTPVGHGIIKRLMHKPEWEKQIIFAGEHSGHYYYPEFNCADSGTLSALYMIACLRKFRHEGRSLEAVAEAWRQKYHESGEINLTLPDRQKVYQALERAWEYFRALGCSRLEVRENELSGLPEVFPAAGEYHPATMKIPDLKVIFPSQEEGGWCVVRPSGNEPILRFSMETTGKNAAERLQKLLADVVTVE